MCDASIAYRLLIKIGASDGDASVSVWHDKAQPYLKVYLAPGAMWLRDRVPEIYEGVSVEIEPMPQFATF